MGSESGSPWRAGGGGVDEAAGVEDVTLDDEDITTFDDDDVGMVEEEDPES